MKFFNALALIVNHDFEHLSFTDVNEKCITGLFRPDVSNEIQYFNEHEFAVIDYGKCVFTIKDITIVYYTSPVDPDIEKHNFSEKENRLLDYYYYRVFNNPGINQGALLIQKGDNGFEFNTMTMFLNRISMIDIKNSTLLIEEMKRDPEFNKALTIIKRQYEQYKQEKHSFDEENPEETEDIDYSDEYDHYHNTNKDYSSNTEINNESLSKTKSLDYYRVMDNTSDINISRREQLDNYISYLSCNLESSVEFLMKLSLAFFVFLLLTSLL